MIDLLEIEKFNSLLNTDVITDIVAAAFLFIVLCAVFQFSYLLTRLGDEEK